MMSLSLADGEEITVVTDGEDEQRAAEGIKTFFAKGRKYGIINRIFFFNYSNIFIKYLLIIKELYIIWSVSYTHLRQDAVKKEGRVQGAVKFDHVTLKRNGDFSWAGRSILVHFALCGCFRYQTSNQYTVI